MKFLSKTKVFAYIFYVLAFLFLLYTLFAIVSTVGYLSSVMSSGMYVDVGFADMLQAFVSAVGPTLFYTCVFFFCGYMIQLVAGDIIPQDQTFEERLDQAPVAEPEKAEEPVEESLNITEDVEPVTLEEPVVLEESVETIELEEPESVEEVVATISEVEAQSSDVVEEEVNESEPIILGTEEEIEE